MRLGLVVNPVAGLGGRVGLGGSDGRDVQRRAVELGAVPGAGERSAVALGELACRAREFELFAASGAMGEESARAAGVPVRVVYRSRPGATGARDTVAAVRALAGVVDLLLFAGGDGTARDVLEADAGIPVLGIPTGVKMHSAVFAVNPRAAGEIVAGWASGLGRPEIRPAEVMDRDETELRRGRLTSRLYGWLPVPYVPVRVQQRKAGSSGVSPEAVGGIAAELGSRVGEGDVLVLGPGTTTRAVAAALGAEIPLTGVTALVREAAGDGCGCGCGCGCVEGCCSCRGLCPRTPGLAPAPPLHLDPRGSCTVSCGCVVAGRAVPRAPEGAAAQPPSPSASRRQAAPSYRPLATHLTSAQLLTLATHHPLLLALSPIGGQGFLLGRGNQQISPEVLRTLTPGKLLVLATEAKLAALHNRPLLIDTGDDALDAELSGYVTVLTGRGRTALYRLSH
ncbi:ATP-NAD kinase family protein [Streptomyces sp. NPDC087440]|uniref:ATP-NAD kinase family protein n=1 Tax=Streptomyces sp. NPDC087440 TaxID=3365790 RepID=UPI00381A1CA5